jgi:hypothetical protein
MVVPTTIYVTARKNLPAYLEIELLSSLLILSSRTKLEKTLEEIDVQSSRVDEGGRTSSLVHFKIPAARLLACESKT